MAPTKQSSGQQQTIPFPILNPNSAINKYHRAGQQTVVRQQNYQHAAKIGAIYTVPNPVYGPLQASEDKILQANKSNAERQEQLKSLLEELEEKREEAAKICNDPIGTASLGDPADSAIMAPIVALKASLEEQKDKLEEVHNLQTVKEKELTSLKAKADEQSDLNLDTGKRLASRESSLLQREKIFETVREDFEKTRAQFETSLREEVARPLKGPASQLGGNSELMTKMLDGLQQQRQDYDRRAQEQKTLFEERVQRRVGHILQGERQAYEKEVESSLRVKYTKTEESLIRLRIKLEARRAEMDTKAAEAAKVEEEKTRELEERETDCEQRENAIESERKQNSDAKAATAAEWDEIKKARRIVKKDEQDNKLTGEALRDVVHAIIERNSEKMGKLGSKLKDTQIDRDSLITRVEELTVLNRNNCHQFHVNVTAYRNELDMLDSKFQQLSQSLDTEEDLSIKTAQYQADKIALDREQQALKTREGEVTEREVANGQAKIDVDRRHQTLQKKKDALEAEKAMFNESNARQLCYSLLERLSEQKTRPSLPLTQANASQIMSAITALENKSALVPGLRDDCRKLQNEKSDANKLVQALETEVAVCKARNEFQGTELQQLREQVRKANDDKLTDGSLIVTLRERVKYSDEASAKTSEEYNREKASLIADLDRFRIADEVQRHEIEELKAEKSKLLGEIAANDEDFSRERRNLGDQLIQQEANLVKAHESRVGEVNTKGEADKRRALAALRTELTEEHRQVAAALETQYKEEKERALQQLSEHARQNCELAETGHQNALNQLLAKHLEEKQGALETLRMKLSSEHRNEVEDLETKHVEDKKNALEQQKAAAAADTQLALSHQLTPLTTSHAKLVRRLQIGAEYLVRRIIILEHLSDGLRQCLQRLRADNGVARHLIRQSLASKHAHELQMLSRAQDLANEESNQAHTNAMIENNKAWELKVREDSGECQIQMQQLREPNDEQCAQKERQRLRATGKSNRLVQATRNMLTRHRETLRRMNSKTSSLKRQHSAETRKLIENHSDRLRTMKTEHDASILTLEKNHATDLEKLKAESDKAACKLTDAHNADLKTIGHCYSQSHGVPVSGFTKEWIMSVIERDDSRARNLTTKLAAEQAAAADLRTKLSSAETSHANKVADQRKKHADAVARVSKSHKEDLNAIGKPLSDVRELPKGDFTRKWITDALCEYSATTAQNYKDYDQAIDNLTAKLSEAETSHAAEIVDLNTQHAEAIANLSAAHTRDLNGIGHWFRDSYQLPEGNCTMEWIMLTLRTDNDNVGRLCRRLRRAESTLKEDRKSHQTTLLAMQASQEELSTKLQNSEEAYRSFREALHRRLFPSEPFDDKATLIAIAGRYITGATDAVNALHELGFPLDLPHCLRDPHTVLGSSIKKFAEELNAAHRTKVEELNAMHRAEVESMWPQCATYVIDFETDTELMHLDYQTAVESQLRSQQDRCAELVEDIQAEYARSQTLAEALSKSKEALRVSECDYKRLDQKVKADADTAARKLQDLQSDYDTSRSTVSKLQQTLTSIDRANNIRLHKRLFGQDGAKASSNAPTDHMPPATPENNSACAGDRTGLDDEQANKRLRIELFERIRWE